MILFQIYIKKMTMKNGRNNIMSVLEDHYKIFNKIIKKQLKYR